MVGRWFEITTLEFEDFNAWFKSQWVGIKWWEFKIFRRRNEIIPEKFREFRIEFGEEWFKGNVVNYRRMYQITTLEFEEFELGFIW